MFCLVKEPLQKFRAKVLSGEIDPDKLSAMSSKERRIFFSKFLGEKNAKEVNSLFESKLLLKNQQKGIANWAKQVTGMKPRAKRDILDRVNKMDKILNPVDEQAFLEDIAAHKMGVTITMEEAGHIYELAKIATDKKGKGDRLDYGRARIAFGNYVNDLKIAAQTKTVSEYMKSVAKSPFNAVSDVAGVSKSVKSSLDLSYIFRQGWKAMFTHPKIWMKNSLKSFKDVKDTFGGKAVMDEVNADIVSRPTYDLMRRAKLAVGTIEEGFPSSAPERIPVLGKFFKASQDAFTAQAYRSRADIFDKYLEIAERNGVDLTDEKQLRGIGELTNSITGRGTLGRYEPVATSWNKFFFSPRLLKSNLDILIHPIKGTAFQRKQASINLLKIAGGTALILAIADAADDEAVDWDPRSSNFGKIKIGNTRFDVSGGMASMAVLSSRMITGESKSSTSGIITQLNSGEFGSQTKFDVTIDFFKNKLSPLASTGLHLYEGKTFAGDKPTIISEFYNIFMPLPITNFQELSEDPESAPILLALIADGLGLGTNTYGLKVSWSQKTTEEFKQFKEKVGEEKFIEINKEFNVNYNNWYKQVIKDSKYTALSNDEKKDVLSKKRESLKRDIFKEYHFKKKEIKAKKLPKF